MPTALFPELVEPVPLQRPTRRRSRWGLIVGLALLLLFVAWFMVMSEDARLRGIVRVKTASFLQVAIHTVAFYAPPLPGGRSPRVEVRDPGRPPYYVADFNNASPGLAYAVEEDTTVLLDRETTLPLCRIISLTTIQAPGSHITATAIVQYAGFLGSIQTLAVGVWLPDWRFKGPWGVALARP